MGLSEAWTMWKDLAQNQLATKNDDWSGSDMRAKEESQAEEVQGVWRRKTPELCGRVFILSPYFLPSHNREMGSV